MSQLSLALQLIFFPQPHVSGKNLVGLGFFFDQQLMPVTNQLTLGRPAHWQTESAWNKKFVWHFYALPVVDIELKTLGRVHLSTRLCATNRHHLCGTILWHHYQDLTLYDFFFIVRMLHFMISSSPGCYTACFPHYQDVTLYHSIPGCYTASFLHYQDVIPCVYLTTRILPCIIS